MGEKTVVQGTGKGGRYVRVSGMLAGDLAKTGGSYGAPPAPFQGLFRLHPQVINVSELTYKRHLRYGGGHGRSIKQKESGVQEENRGDVQYSCHS